MAHNMLKDNIKSYKVYPNKNRIKFKNVSQDLYKRLIHYKILKKHLACQE